TEVVVLGEHQHLAAGEVADEGGGGLHVLPGLATGAEGVVVDAGDRIGGGGTGDVQRLVLFGQRRQLYRHPGGGGAGDDLVTLADQVGGYRGGGGGLGGVVVVGHLQGDAPYLVAAAGGVLQPGPEALRELLAVAGQQAAGGGEYADADHLLLTAATAAGLTACG